MGKNTCLWEPVDKKGGQIWRAGCYGNNFFVPDSSELEDEADFLCPACGKIIFIEKQV